MDGLTGNTLDSHRLIAYAGRQGYDVQDKVVEELFKAYFTEASPLPSLLVHQPVRLRDPPAPRHCHGLGPASPL